MNRVRWCRWSWMALAALVGCTDATGLGSVEASAQTVTGRVVDTGQDRCYDAWAVISCPAPGAAYHGQDAQHAGNAARYETHGDGTVTDVVTGLVWTQTPDLDGNGRIGYADKLTYTQALAYAETLVWGGHDDWRLPTIKELYSLMDFRGVDASGPSSASATPFLDTSVFAFGYGDTGSGERAIDAQFATSTLYVGTTMGGNQTMFGVNFADGRIKGYPAGPTPLDAGGKRFYVLFVRGGTGYGENVFVDNGDGTVTDEATGLMWSREDSGVGMNWEEALAWADARNAEGWLGHDDWRLPDAKELQSLVDYSRAPAVTGSASIDPVFSTTGIVNEAGQRDYPAFWTGTTHQTTSMEPGGWAVYVCFGQAMGYMEGRWMDVHGAGAQRSDPKEGYADEWPRGHGPQGDAVRVANFVRLVRDAG